MKGETLKQAMKSAMKAMKMVYLRAELGDEVGDGHALLLGNHYWIRNQVNQPYASVSPSYFETRSNHSGLQLSFCWLSLRNLPHKRRLLSYTSWYLHPHVQHIEPALCSEWNPPVRPLRLDVALVLPEYDLMAIFQDLVG